MLRSQKREILSSVAPKVLCPSEKPRLFWGEALTSSGGWHQASSPTEHSPTPWCSCPSPPPGVGYGMMVVSTYIGIYYNVVICIAFYY